MPLLEDIRWKPSKSQVALMVFATDKKFTSGWSNYRECHNMTLEWGLWRRPIHNKTQKNSNAFEKALKVVEQLRRCCLTHDLYNYEILAFKN